MFITSSSPVDLTGINHNFYGNLQYGSTNKEILDIWIPTDAIGDTGIVIYIHGGGFYQSDKSDGYNESLIQSLLSNNIAYATIDYDLVETNHENIGYYGPLNSTIMAIKYLKYYHDTFNLDKTKFILKGGSAGAGLAMLIAYNTDYSLPSDPNYIKRESTSVKAITLLRPQSTYDYIKWETEVFSSINDYSAEDEYNNVIEAKKAVDRTYATNSWNEYLSNTSYRNDLDMLQMIDNNGGIETYINSPDTLYNTVVNYSIPDASHSPYHGLLIKTYLDNESTPNVCYLNGLYTDPSGETEIDFIIRKIEE